MALVAKTCPPPTTAVLQKNQQLPRVSVGSSYYAFAFALFLMSQLKVPQGKATTKNVKNVRTSDCVGPIVSDIYRPMLI